MVHKTLKYSGANARGKRGKKKAPASHAKRVFQAPDVNNGVVDVEEKMSNKREREGIQMSDFGTRKNKIK